jgi:hypothetical protein
VRDNLAAVHVDDRLCIEHQAVLVQGVADPADPGEPLELLLVALLADAPGADVGKHDGDTLDLVVDGDWRCAVGDGQQPAVSAGERIVLDADGRAGAQRGLQPAIRRRVG